MPPSLHAWYSFRDIESLAARKAVLSAAIQLDEMSRLSDLVEVNAGSVDVRLAFDFGESALLTLQLRYATEVVLVCQRCLETMPFRIDGDVEFGILPEASREACMPAGVEPMILNGERLCPQQLIEDELIVSLPLVPKHADDDRCGVLFQHGEGATSERADNKANA